MKRTLAKTLLSLGLAAPLLAGPNSVTIPSNDFEKSTQKQIRDLREEISRLKTDKGDVYDRRNNLMVHIIEEMLRDKSDQALAQKDPQRAAFLQKEMTDLEAFRDDVWAHSLKIRDLEHQLQQVRVGLMDEMLARAIATCEDAHRDQLAGILKENRISLRQTQPIIDQIYELRQKATATKESNDYEDVPEIRRQIDDLQAQYDRIMDGVQEKMRQIGIKPAADMQSI